MGFISEQMEKIYKSVLFRRHDADGSIFYFDHSDFEGLLKREHSFTTQKGHKLYGAFYCYDNSNSDVLIVFDHGLANGHRSYMREIERLCRQGYYVYTFDHTGCGLSEGDHVGGLLGSLADMDDCLNMLKNYHAVAGRKIMLVGHSRGGFSSLNILRNHPEVKKVVAMSGFVSLSVMLKQLVPSLIMPIRDVIYRLEKNNNPDYADFSALETLEKTDTPVLLIHSLDDSTVNAKLNILSLQKKLSNRKNLEFLILNGRGHNPNYTREAVIYKDKFFKEHSRLKKKGLLENDTQKSNLINSYDWYAMTEQDEDVWNKIFSFLDK